MESLDKGKGYGLSEAIPFVQRLQDFLRQLTPCHRVCQSLMPDSYTNMGAITSQKFGTVPTPRIHPLSEVNLELGEPSKKPPNECIGTHEGCRQGIVGSVHHSHFSAEGSEGESACLHPSDEVPPNFITSPSDCGVEKE